MKTAILASFVSTALLATQSLAGIREVKTCAAKLPDPAQLILQAVAPKLKPGVNARKVMKSTVISMVQSGEIDQSEARTNAQAAGRCLKKLQD